MASISHEKNSWLMNSAVDFFDWTLAESWIEEGKKQIKLFNTEKVDEKDICFFDWSENESGGGFPFGYYPSECWRKFVLAVFFADLISYENPVDQVNFERLLFVMHAFPQGFRVWGIKLTDGKYWPVGYTAWYPMSEMMFEIFQKSPEKLKDRTVVPDAKRVKEKKYLYLFNYSVVPALKNTALTKQMLQRFDQDIKSQSPSGLACVTVSADGMRVAKRFGMSHTGDFDIDGSIENVYATSCS
jgi:hypothetical protein